eukprot:scaffold6531_cov38-Phaeocystis_antarctica.AAC.1
MGWHRTTRCSLGSAYTAPLHAPVQTREVRALCCPASACALSLSSHPAHLGPHVLVGSWSLCVERLSVIGCGCVSSRSTFTSVFIPPPCVSVTGEDYLALAVAAVLLPNFPPAHCKRATVCGR